MDIPDTFNSIIYATNQPTEPGNLDANFAYLQGRGDSHPLLMDVMQTTLTHMQGPPKPALVLTDDHAPIEWITSSLILDFFLSGEAETIQ